MATETGKVTRFTNVDVVVTGLGPALDFRYDGYDDGTSISLAPQGDRNTVRLGNDGRDCFAESASRHWIWTLSVLESSDALDKASAWLESGLTANVSYLDKNGRTAWSGRARLRQYPTVGKSGGVESLSMDLHVIGAVGKVGGLNDPG
jgi:hypothetical protein